MMYIDYKKDDIKDFNNIVNTISKSRNIEIEVINTYFKKYNDIPYVFFSDTIDLIDYLTIKKRLLLIHRKLKINKLYKDKR
jgi:hypothetical protein